MVNIGMVTSFLYGQHGYDADLSSWSTWVNVASFYLVNLSKNHGPPTCYMLVGVMGFPAGRHGKRDTNFLCYGHEQISHVSYLIGAG